MRLVVDSSVAVKWFAAEPGFEAAVALLDGEPDFHAPDLIFAEVANVMWKKARRGQASIEQVTRATANLESIVKTIVPCRDLMPRAADLARNLDHPAYDCFYLACAEQADAPLVTADQRLIAATARGGLSRLVTPLHA